MAFKASTPIPQLALDRIRTQAVATKNYLTQQKAAMSLNPVSANVILAVIQHFGNVIFMVTNAAQTPGILQYAKDQVNDQTYDIAAEFMAWRSAMVTARDTLISMFPKDANGYILYQTINADGSLAVRNFTPGQVATALPLLDAVIASID